MAELNPDQFHAHYMVEGREPHPFRAGRKVACQHGPFHSPEEAAAVIKDRNVSSARLLFYGPGKLEHD